MNPTKTVEYYCSIVQELRKLPTEADAPDEIIGDEEEEK